MTMPTTLQGRAFELERELETLLDQTSLAIMLEALASVCSDKAAHIAENWQDSATAKEWIKATRAINQALHQVGDL